MFWTIYLIMLDMIELTFNFLGEVFEKVEPSQCGQVERSYQVANNSFTVYVSWKVNDKILLQIIFCFQGE